MLEAISSEQLTSFGLIGVNVLVMVGSLFAIWPERQKKSDIDVDAAVRNAPFHLLEKL
ncbi:hypothetical protein [Sulfitobacter sp.]|uniref:hypothetical protein n=1 Tax=Sulfitobacter sp. TaxID=1903071 RepID=UPI003296C40B